MSYQTKINEKYYKISNSLQKVAKYLLEYPEDFAVKTAAEIGKEIAVSETTIIRFAHTLEYNGYRELQDEVRSTLFNIKSSLDNYSQKKLEIKKDTKFYEQVMNLDRENILRTAINIDEEQFNEAVNKLTNAKSILVAGMRSSHGMAHWFTFAMNLVRGGTNLFRPETDDVILRVSEMNEDSVFVAFSFHRYATETLKLAKEMQKKGVFVIGVTDSPAAPIAQFSDNVFSIPTSKKSTLDTAPVCFSLLNAMVSNVALNMPEEFELRKKNYESNHLKNFFQ